MDMWKKLKIHPLAPHHLYILARCKNFNIYNTNSVLSVWHLWQMLSDVVFGLNTYLYPCRLLRFLLIVIHYDGYIYTLLKTGAYNASGHHMIIKLDFQGKQTFFGENLFRSPTCIWYCDILGITMKGSL